MYFFFLMFRMLPLLLSNLAVLITLAIHNNLDFNLNNDKKNTPNSSDNHRERI